VREIGKPKKSPKKPKAKKPTPSKPQQHLGETKEPPHPISNLSSPLPQAPPPQPEGGKEEGGGGNDGEESSGSEYETDDGEEGEATGSAPVDPGFFGLGVFGL
jgi:hypothetical protein